MKRSNKQIVRNVLLVAYFMWLICTLLISVLPSKDDMVNEKARLSGIASREHDLAEKVASLSEQSIELESHLNGVNARIDERSDLALSMETEINLLQAETRVYKDAVKSIKNVKLDLVNSQFDDAEKLVYVTSEYIKLKSIVTQYKYANFTLADYILLTDYCETYSVPIELALSVIERESNFNPNAKNPNSTATGYMQVLDGTGKWLYGLLELEDVYGVYTPDIRFNREVNLHLGTYLLNLHNQSYGSFEIAVQRYYGSTDASLNKEYSNKILKTMTYNYDTTFKELDKN